ncbi:MAG TPA: helix-turn-helix domain-containing protein [Nitrososphaerales archaeon]|nr:helix-turn-helix domain-containing protein [Nitrososphaerales archaeon]
MSQAELDSMLGTVENPIRRRIIARLSQKPNYQLQLSKELDISQQLVAKHLGSMEEAGLVSTVFEDSPRGPQRKEYLLRKSVSITIDLAPSLFRARMFSFGAVPGADSDEHGKTTGEVNKFLMFPDEAARLKPLAEIIAEVDRKLDEMEERRAVLLYLRGLALREAASVTRTLGSEDRKKVLRYIMKEQREGLSNISSSLGLHQNVVGNILEEIEKDLVGK